MWRVYRHTGNDNAYEVYKEALNAATNEVRNSKRNYEHKLAQNIKSDIKSFYAYVRSKQNVRDKVGPLEDNVGNIITQGFLMTDELNLQEVVATKINNRKEHKLPGVDGISPKILKETVEQTVHHLHTCLTCHCGRELYLRM